MRLRSPRPSSAVEGAASDLDDGDDRLHDTPRSAMSACTLEVAGLSVRCPIFAIIMTAVHVFSDYLALRMCGIGVRHAGDVRGRSLVGEDSAQLRTRPDWTMHEKQPLQSVESGGSLAPTTAGPPNCGFTAASAQAFVSAPGTDFEALPVALSSGYSTNVHCTLTSPSLWRAPFPTDHNPEVPAQRRSQAFQRPRSVNKPARAADVPAYGRHPASSLALHPSLRVLCALITPPFSDADDDGDNEPDKQKKEGMRMRARFGVRARAAV
ncbi:hypothetical protein GGX14DRAFT_553642 [Mycena pura]|uniref:Uncharacterized protein n=1 Tax=Mycena pura TaxID=153505 RepID=A0AAD6YUR9_9AGAR|nr:hypothetical protein GGX14DRAFT_553642 [Mycena pura]